MSAHLRAFGMHVPERVVTNAEIAGWLGITPDWIESVSGIRERRFASAETSIVDLAELACGDCLARAAMPPADIGLLILATGSAPAGFPAPAAELAHRLGLASTPALDLPIASAGSIFGLVLASQLAASYGNVLVVAAEKMSGIVQGHPLDQNTAILFGDGAGAALVTPQGPGRQIRCSRLHTDGQFRGDLYYNTTEPLKMNGLSIILQASRKLPAVIQEVLSGHRSDPSAVQMFLLHQANQNLIVRVAKTLKVDPARVFTNVARYGNTSSASLLIAAAEWSSIAQVEGPIVLAGFGAGLHWGALVAE